MHVSVADASFLFVESCSTLDRYVKTWPVQCNFNPAVLVPAMHTLSKVALLAAVCATLFSNATAPARFWELRQYNDGAERVPHTVDRFGSGEKEIFTKHGMQTVKFWTVTDNSASIYLLAHKDKASSDESWKGFRSEFPEFMKKYRDSHLNPLGFGSPKSRLSPESSAHVQGVNSISI